MIEHRAADVLSLYPGKHGGVRWTQEIASLAEAAGVVCTIGSNLEREVATAAMAHVAAATANIQCERFPRRLDRAGLLRCDPTTAPLRYEADRIWPPDEPGLGVRMASVEA